MILFSLPKFQRPLPSVFSSFFFQLLHLLIVHSPFQFCLSFFFFFFQPHPLTSPFRLPELLIDPLQIIEFRLSFLCEYP